MRLFIKLAVFFYLVVIFVAGFTALMVLAHFVDYGQYISFLEFVYQDGKASTVAGIITAVTMLISLAFARVIYGRQQAERLIHFDNPVGRVTISLSAIEDLIRRLTVHTPQVKEIRPNIVSTRKGLDIEIKLVLRSDVNIPEMTADLQELIRRKVQDVIGNDDPVNIRVHVIKIVSDSSSAGKGRGDEAQAITSSIPFHGYRA